MEYSEWVAGKEAVHVNDRSVDTELVPAGNRNIIWVSHSHLSENYNEIIKFFKVENIKFNLQCCKSCCN